MKKVLPVVLGVGIAVLIAFGVWRLLPHSAGSADGLQYEENVTVGAVENLSREELVEQMNQKVADSMLTMSINATPSMSLSRPEAGANWLIENPANQGKLVRVEVARNDTGEKIYETGALKPGTYVTDTPAAVTLDAGEYECTATFYAYDMDTQAPLGQAGAEITLTVLP